MERITYRHSPLIDAIIPLFITTGLNWGSEYKEYEPHARAFLETATEETVSAIVQYISDYKESSGNIGNIWDRYDWGPFADKNKRAIFIIGFENFIHSIFLVKEGYKEPPPYEGLQRQVVPPLEVYEYHSFNEPTGRYPSGCKY